MSETGEVLLIIREEAKLTEAAARAVLAAAEATKAIESAVQAAKELEKVVSEAVYISDKL